MKIFNSIIIAGIVTISCNQNSPADSNTENTDSTNLKAVTNELYLVSDKGAGIYKFGEQIPEHKLFKYIVTDTIIFEEGNQTKLRLVKVFQNDSLQMVLELDENRTISEIDLVSNKFKTIEGLGVGSKLSQFIKSYSDYELFYTYVSDRFVVNSKKMYNLQFIIDPIAYSAKSTKTTESDMVTLKPDEFRPDATIIKIRLYKL